MEENKMAVMPVRRLLLHMSWPMMLSMLIQALYNLVDSMFVAQLSTDGFVALSLAYPVQTLMISICVGTGVGVNTILSRRLGERRPAEASAVAMNGYFLYLCCWLIFLIPGVLFSRPFLALFSDVPQVVDYGSQYLAIVTAGSLGVCMQFSGERVLQASGDAVGPMCIQGIGAVVNLLLDPLLIFGLGPFPRLEVAGAALATVMTLGMNKLLSFFSATGVFILGAYFKLQSFLFMPVYGLNNGLIPVVSFNYGAKKRERITGLIHFALIIAAGLLAAGTLLLLLVPGPLLGLFNADAAVLADGVPALRLVSLSFVFAAVGIIFSSSFQALGCPMLSLILSLLRQVVLLLPAALVLGLLAPRLIWLSFLLAEGFSSLLALVLYRRLYRTKLARLEE